MATYQYNQNRRPCTNWTYQDAPALVNLSAEGDKRESGDILPGDIVTSKLDLRAPEFIKIDAKTLTLAKAKEKLGA